MGEMSAVPKGHPLIVAWDAWKQTDGFAATRKWAHVEEHLEGSLWAAFMEGWLAAERAAPSDAALSQDVIAVVREALEEMRDAAVALCAASVNKRLALSAETRLTAALDKARAALALLATDKGE